MTRIDLSKNQLKFLTEDFCNLVNLRHLDLYNNQLENLPVNFGKLNKLRYLDLKGNPLQPALAKIVGPCLTTKDCLDAAKQIVPFMVDLEKHFRAEQQKKEDEEAKRQEEEAKLARDLAFKAKKAARKERVMRERQAKAEEEKLLGNQESTGDDSEEALPKKSTNSKAIKPSSFLSFLKTCILVMLFVSVLFVLALKFFPLQVNKILLMLPRDQQLALRTVLGKVNSRLGIAKARLSEARARLGSSSTILSGFEYSTPKKIPIFLYKNFHRFS